MIIKLNIADKVSGSQLTHTEYNSLKDKTDELVDVVNKNPDIKNIRHSDFGAVGDGVADDTEAIKAAVAAAGIGGIVYIPNGTYIVSETIEFLQDQIITGQSNNSVIKANASITIVRPPHGRGMLDNIRICGNSIEGCNGIVCNSDFRPYSARWGKVEIESCPGMGLSFENSSGAIGYNSFDKISIKYCGIGLRINPTETGWCNANVFNYVGIQFCETGIEVLGGAGNTFNYLEVENSSIVGLSHISGYLTRIEAGWFEDNLENFIISSYPDTNGFWCGAGVDESSLPSHIYAGNNSQLHTFKEGGIRYALRDRWWFDNLSAIPDYEESGTLMNIILGGYGQKYYQKTSGNEIDVTNFNAINLAYTEATVVTNLVRSGDFINHRSQRFQQVTLVGSNGNATINHGGNFILKNGENWTSALGKSIVFVYDIFLTKWIEISRT